MDAFEFNKIAGAVLGTMLAIAAINQIGDLLVHPKHLEKNAAVIVEVAEATEGAKGAAGAPAEPAKPLPVLFAEAKIADGEKSFKKCAACHGIDKGGAAKVGPNLYGIVGDKKAHMASFAYSDAMKGKGGEWTIEDLFAYLENPKAFVPGNKMAFAGIKKASERADVIAYLNKQSDAPLPLPK